jgi:hypothetical protein
MIVERIRASRACTSFYDLFLFFSKVLNSSNTTGVASIFVVLSVEISVYPRCYSSGKYICIWSK